ncbi:hypothetical protein SAMN06295943_1624 [Agreia sp. VKM Ac-1783]|nr:hypothetical protein SAMN06295943_1624 [Agreia sp. VKM Ac-1783]
MSLKDGAIACTRGLNRKQQENRNGKQSKCYSSQKSAPVQSSLEVTSRGLTVAPSKETS